MNELGFNRNHYLIGLAAIAVFAALVFPRTGIQLSAMFSQADEVNPKITYEQMRGEVYAQMGVTDDEKYLQDLENQFALLDRGQVDGAVLGQAIGIGAVPSAEQIFTREMLDQIVLTTSSDNTPDNMKKYSEQVLQVETGNEALSTLAALNSSDSQALEQSKDQVDKIVSGLLGVTVPSELLDYHRYKLIYYQNLKAIADSFSGDNANSDLQNQTSILLSVMERIEQTKSEIWAKYQVQL